jgi:transposase
MQMDKQQYGRAKASLVFSMQEGHSWQVAEALAEVQISQSNAYRLWRAFRQHGETALTDGRHGHPCKLRGAARAFLEERCRQAPQTPSSTIQLELQERFDLHVSVSQINRVRAALGISNHPKNREQEKKSQKSSLRRVAPQSGRKAQGVCCYWRQLTKRVYSCP